jgi:hypothetical protein
MVADAAAKGTICNIVNEATYDWPTTETDITTGLGTSFSDFGYLFRGVTGASATPGYATIAASGGDAIRRWVRINSGGGWCIFRNLIFNSTGKTADSSAYTGARYNSSGGPVWFDGCGLISGNTGATSTGTRQLLNVQATGSNGTRFYDCYFQNLSSTFHNLGATLTKETIGNIFYNDVAAGMATLMSQTLAAGTGGSHIVTFNTIYASIGNFAFAYPIIYGMSGTNGGTVDVNSNLVYFDSTNAAPNIGLLSDPGAGIAFSGTLGFNVLLGGANISIADLAAGGYYTGSFDAGSDPKATDQVAYSVAEATIFNNPAGTYAWDALGNGATITILKDLRPRLYLTAGLGGTVPGALPAASTDYGIDLATDNTAPTAGSAFTITVTASNTGTSATSITMTAFVPTGLTLTLATPSAGSYNPVTGLWTIGSLASAGTATLTLAVTVDSDQSGNTIVMTASTTSGDPANDTNSANNTDTLSLPIPFTDTTDPNTTTFLDVAPIFAPVLMAEINAIFRTHRNRLTQHELRKDFERRTWREYSARRLTIAPSTTVSIVTAIERVDFFALEADGDLEVSVSNSATDVYSPPVQQLALLAGSFTTLKLRNPSASASVNALLVVID